MASVNEKEKGKEVKEDEFQETMGRRLEGLTLVGEEEDDLDFSAELDELVKDVRWLAIFKVATTKPFSHAALFGAMRFAWTAAKEVTFKVLEVNLFMVQFQCLGDWNRVMEGGPWLFRGAPIAMEEYDGFSNVHEIKLDRIPVWCRINGVPDGLMKKKELAEKVAAKVGKPITVVVNEGKINPTPYLRARVFMELNKPLVRVVPITLKEKKLHLVQYEKLPIFCFYCGVMGHELTECGDGTKKEEECEWGTWLVVQFGSLRGGRNEITRSRGRVSARGRGRGRNSVAREEEEEDVGMEADVFTEPPTTDIVMVGSEVTSPIKLQDKKRMRKGDGEEDNIGSISLSAPSIVEGDRKQ